MNAPEIWIDELDTSTGEEFDIGYADTVLAKCWDYQLAEALRDTISDYMKVEYKVNGKENY